MDIRFVQGFIDEINRQKLVQKQQATTFGPLPGDRRMDAVEQARGTYRATPASAQAIRRAAPVKGSVAPPNRYQTMPGQYEEPPFSSYDPSAPNAGVAATRQIPTTSAVDHRMDEIEARRAAIPEAPLNIVPAGELGVGNRYEPGMIQVPETPPEITPINIYRTQPSARFPVSPIDPQGHTGDVSPFRSEQRSEAVVAQHDARVQGEELGTIETQMAANRQEMAALDAQIQSLYNQYGQSMTPEQSREIVALENQYEALVVEQNTFVNQRQEMYGANPALGLVGGFIGAISEVVDKPFQTKMGEFGYWYVENMGDPSTTGAAIGMLSNSPIGAVASADGVGVADYVKWLETHPDEVRVVQQDGYTDPQTGQHHTGGYALYEYYKDSQNLFGQVVTEAVTSPTTYVELAAGAGGIAGRWGRAAAEAIPENTIAGRAARAGVRGTTAVVETGLRAPYAVLDYAADEIVGGIGRGVKNVAMGTSRLPELAGNIFRGTPDVTLDDGTVIRGANASGGVFGAVPRPNAAADTPLASQAQETIERIDAITRFRNTSAEQLRQNQAAPTPPPSGAGSRPRDTGQINFLTRQRNQALQDGDYQAAAQIQRQIDALEAQSGNWGAYQPTAPAEPGAASVVQTPGPEGGVMVSGEPAEWYRADMPPTAQPEPPPLALPPGEIPPQTAPPGFSPNGGRIMQSAETDQFRLVADNASAEAGGKGYFLEIRLPDGTWVRDPNHPGWNAGGSLAFDDFDRIVAGETISIGPNTSYTPPGPDDLWSGTTAVPVGPIEPIGPRDWRNPNLVWNGTHWVEPPALPPMLGAGPPPPEHIRLMNDWMDAQAYGDETGDYSLANILARQIDDLEQETAERLAPEPDIDLAPLGDEAAPDAYVSPTDVAVVRDRNSTDIFVGPDEMDIRVETIQVVNPRTGTSNRYIVTGPPTSPRGVRVTLDETEFTVQREAIARARRLVVGEEGPPAAAAAPDDVIDPADIPTYRVNDDGTVTPVVDGEDLFDADFPSLYSEADARQAVRDLADEPVVPSSVTQLTGDDIPTGLLRTETAAFPNVTGSLDTVDNVYMGPGGEYIAESGGRFFVYDQIPGTNRAGMALSPPFDTLEDAAAFSARRSGSPVPADVPPAAAAPTGQTTLPTDRLTKWRQWAVGRAKMYDDVLDRMASGYYTSRGLDEKVDQWFQWLENRIKERDAASGAPSPGQTPLGQSVTDRAEDEIQFIRMVGDTPPDQVNRGHPETGPTLSSMIEAAVFEPDEKKVGKLYSWFYARFIKPPGQKRIPGGKNLPEVVTPDSAYGVGEINTYADMVNYIKWLRDRRKEALDNAPGVQRAGSNAGPNLPSGTQLTSRGRAARRLRAAQIAEAKKRNAAKLPGDTSRNVVLADEEERLLNTKIADLGNVGRSDRWEGGAVKVRGRGEGDQATVRSVYDPVFNAARAAGDSIEVAHQKAMAEVSRRVIADFAANETSGRLARMGDLLAGWHSQMSRYGDPVKFLRSAQGDWIGDSIQMMLSEGPVTALKMNTMLLGNIKKGPSWNDTGAGAKLRERGIDPNAFASGHGIVQAEQAGRSGGKSAAMKVATPKLWKLSTDSKLNPARGYAKGMDWMRSVNDKLEMTRRTAAQIFLFDKELLRQSRDFHLVARRNRRLTQGVGVTDDDLKATVASLGTRFSRQDMSAGMERLARARGATAKDAATFGERIGRDWANIENLAYKQAKERVNKALFSYQYTNMDVKMRRFVPFHYWATRAIPFYTEAAIRNPALAYAYYELVKGLKERSEAEGWPDSLKFLVAVWTGPMGYIFFADPVANMGLIGLTDMLFPYNDRDETKSPLGRFLDMATGRTGLGILPALTWPAALMGMMGNDTFALDPTATYATRELYGGIINWAIATGILPGNVNDGQILGKPFQQFMMDARERVSGWAEDMNIPFAREIESTDAMAYTNQQIRNGMIDLLMQEKGYDNINQLTPEDWTIINEQYRAQDGNLYADAMADQATANAIDRAFMGLLVGTTPVRQEGMLQRQINQTGQQRQDGTYAEDPRGSPFGTPEPGATPTLGQAYESGANLNGRYGRTQGGLSLPREDPYADAILTEGERQFIELWRQENQKPMTTEEWQEGGTQITTVNGDTITIPAGSTVAEAAAATYQQGDLEVLRESERYAETMARTTPEAAPYVAGEMGYYNLGPEAHGEVINQYWNIVFADPNLGTIFIGTEDYTPDQITNMSDDDRGLLADAWLADRDADGSIRRTMAMREAWLDAHPEYAAYRDWAKEIRDSYDGNIGAYRNDLISGNPNAARYLEDQARLARMEVDANANPSGVNPKTKLREGTSGTGSVEAYYAELDQRTLNLGAYLAINGIQRNIGDPKPDAIGTPGPAPGPYDPRPAGWAPPSDESGSGGSSGGSGRTGSGGTDRSRTDWATATIAATESGVAQANALLTQAMGYPVDIMDLPPPIRDAAMAQLPPGLIPDDAWLYFDFIAWQAHQDLNNAPTDLGSYLAATANGRDWKATRSTFSAGGATLVGGTPAQVYRGGGPSSGQDQQPPNPYLNPYSNYFASTP